MRRRFPFFILTCEYLYLHVSFLVDLIEKEVIKTCKITHLI